MLTSVVLPEELVLPIPKAVQKSLVAIWLLLSFPRVQLLRPAIVGMISSAIIPILVGL